MYVCLVARCNSNPMAASGAHPPEVPSVAGNTQADDTLPSIVGRGGANCRITPGPHTQLFGGARPPPPPGNRPPRRPSQNPPPPGTPPSQPSPPKGPPADSYLGGGSWRPKLRGRPPRGAIITRSTRPRPRDTDRMEQWCFVHYRAGGRPFVSQPTCFAFLTRTFPLHTSPSSSCHVLPRRAQS